jgi:hypothetical protein
MTPDNWTPEQVAAEVASILAGQQRNIAVAQRIHTADMASLVPPRDFHDNMMQFMRGEVPEMFRPAPALRQR